MLVFGGVHFFKTNMEPENGPLEKEIPGSM